MRRKSRSIGDQAIEDAWARQERRENMRQGPGVFSVPNNFFIGGPADLGYGEDDDQEPGLLLG